MVTIQEPFAGAILNRHDGTESLDGLTITVRGMASGSGPVLVNGRPAWRTGGSFTADIVIRDAETAIEASCAADSTAVSVLYDQGSYPRYRFSLDDNIWFLRDIAQQGYRSVFENPYLALWKRLHQTYGTKVHCNIYYQCEGFDLTRMPDRHRSEWQDNADWFRMTFHALQN